MLLGHLKSQLESARCIGNQPLDQGSHPRVGAILGPQLDSGIGDKSHTLVAELVGGSGQNGDGETKVDISSAPDFIKLSERVDALVTEKSTEAAETLVDGAIHDGKFLPAQRDALIEVALSEGGMERVELLIPEKAIVDLSERGVEAGHETNKPLSEDDVDSEVDRLVGSYATTGSKKKE